MKKLLTLTLILLTIQLTIAPQSTKEQQSTVESINLQSNKNQISWQTNGHSSKGFKIIWSRNENPTYPIRTGDRYQYHSNPNTNSTTLKPFDGNGTYYARVCEYLGGKCGTYSNQIEIQFGEELINGDTCYDSDGGANYYTKGILTIKSTNETKKDHCKILGNKTILIEQICDPLDREIEIKHDCPEGCIDGKCLKINPTEKTGPIKTPEPIQCNGCPLNKICYPIGYRKNGKFCSDNLKFTNQLKENSICENNFECKSNVCVSGECISQSFIQKIIAWLKKIF